MMAEYTQISTDALMIDTAQSRLGGWDGDEQDERLVESVAEDGIMSPLIIRPVSEAEYDTDEADGEYSIIAGSRRYNAAIENGLDEVPCNVVEADDFEAAVKSLKENEQRKDLSDEELMRSLRMQYEMITPEDDSPPYECKDCEKGPFKSLEKHVGKKENSCKMLSLGRIKNQDRHAQTPAQAYKALAEIHYPEKPLRDGAKYVKNQVKAVELPPALRLLLKDTDDRTLEEKAQLRDEGLSGFRDMSASAKSKYEISEAFESIVRLYETVDETDGLDATTAVTKAVGELDFSQSNTDLSRELNNVRQEFTETVSETAAPEDVQQDFWGVVKQRKEDLRELRDEVGLDELGTFTFGFEQQKYRRYHALASEELRESSNSKLVKNGYQEWLENLAQEHGW